MKKTLLPLLTLLLVGFFACKEDATEPDPNDNNNNNGQDTTQNNNDPKCDPDSVYFVQAVLPALKNSCGVSGCHDATTQQSGLNLTSYNFATNTSFVSPGDKSASSIYLHMTGQALPKMPPPPRSISQADIELIGKWIDQGALNNACEE